MKSFSLKTLETLIDTRSRQIDPPSYTALLIHKGVNYSAKKMGEEAIETIIATLSEDRKRVISESADLIYHLMVLWKISDITLDDILQELGQRTQQSGLAEKMSRQND